MFTFYLTVAANLVVFALLMAGILAKSDSSNRTKEFPTQTEFRSDPSDINEAPQSSGVELLERDRLFGMAEVPVKWLRNSVRVLNDDFEIEPDVCDALGVTERECVALREAASELKMAVLKWEVENHSSESVGEGSIIKLPVPDQNYSSALLEFQHSVEGVLGEQIGKGFAEMVSHANVFSDRQSDRTLEVTVTGSTAWLNLYRDGRKGRSSIVSFNPDMLTGDNPFFRRYMHLIDYDALAENILPLMRSGLESDSK